MLWVKSSFLAVFCLLLASQNVQTPTAPTPAPPPAQSPVASAPTAAAQVGEPAVPPPLVVTLPPNADATAQAIAPLVDRCVIMEMRWPDFTDYRKHLIHFYEARGYTPAWTSGGHVTPQTQAVIERFRAAEAKGVMSADYDAVRWDQRLQRLNRWRPEPAEVALFDVEVTATLMRYISDLHIGRINPRNIEFELDVEQKKYYLPKVLEDVRVAQNVDAILEPVEPNYEQYRRLRIALAAYTRIAAAGDQKPIPVVKVLKPGEAYEGLPPLVELLRRLGDLPASASVDVSKKIYSGPVVEAVKTFQHRHGLTSDGVISAKTFAALNVPISRRLQQLRWAMERWRWLPNDFARPPIVVNVPEFKLRAWNETGSVALEMNVVVGQAYQHQTPIFQGEMRSIVFRPYWNVPPTIQRKELAPKVEKDPSYLDRNGYEVVDENDHVVSPVTPDVVAAVKSVRYTIRQKPSEENALGAVKFLFPNRNNVYLHSTPSQGLFSRSRRDFSHGCIRVENPQRLAEWVLRNEAEWKPERIKSAMASDGPEDQDVRLSSTIPVLILYATAVVEDDGLVHFYDDIYGHDAVLENALAQGYPYPA